jgi:tRNA(Ile)-lysidine synthase
LEFIHIEEILRLIVQGPPHGRASIPGGWEVAREYDALKLVKRFRRSRQVCYNYSLEIGGVLAIPEAGLELYSRGASAMPSPLPEDLMDAFFDAAAVSNPLSVRNFRPGDRFQPLGMSGHKKVKDLFIEKRVPLSVRARWPLVTSGDEVLWIPRYGRSSAGSVSGKTTSVLHLKARPIPSLPNAF